jgi:tRNA dimethylallyltransferase
VRPAAEPGSVAWWRDAALLEMAQARDAGRLPILTGGSGLYFAALTEGLADIPDAGPEARSEARRLLKEVGPAALHARLAGVDPVTASRLRPTDGQRVARAWEVWCGTGTGLAAWQAKGSQPASWRFAAILLDPPRTDLRSAIAQRFSAMLSAGAMDEVRGLLRQELDPAVPAMRAHGVPELAAHLRGELDLPAAQRRVELVTGQYTKRQATWFRHHRLSPQMHTIYARFAGDLKFLERNCTDILAFVESMG